MNGKPSFVIITGLSGAGKSYAIKCFEDMGYFCVDNLPTTLIPTFAALCAQSTREIRRIALGVDVREREYLAHRYHETRRRHPLAADGNVLDGIRAERKAMANVREIADRIVDTSGLTVHQLKELLVDFYGETKSRGALTVSLVSFGYKHGIPYDSDLVFDVRFLP